MKEINDEVGAFVPYDPVDVANAGSGPLAGLTFAVKDIFDVAGYPTGCGNPIKRSESPVHRTSAPVVQHMLDAGFSETRVRKVLGGNFLRAFAMLRPG